MVSNASNFTEPFDEVALPDLNHSKCLVLELEKTNSKVAFHLKSPRPHLAAGLTTHLDRKAWCCWMVSSS